MWGLYFEQKIKGLFGLGNGIVIDDKNFFSI